ncbi:MAG: hypothetical protein EBT89_12705, partial [Opitutaceae bacterium]|nr:hypothetical protein [Opitutaceae bacterium]
RGKADSATFYPPTREGLKKVAESALVARATVVKKMKRVTRKVRAVRSKGAREHLDFNSEKHKQDKAAADRLREPQWVRLPDAPKVEVQPFPRAAELAMVYICFDGTEEAGRRMMRRVEPATHNAHIAAAERDGRVWYTQSKKLKKNGQPKLQKRTGDGVRDCHFSLSPWVSEHLAEMVEAGRLAEARELAQQAVNVARTVLARRTGYKVVGVAVHPDSRGVLGYHLQFQTASGGKLLGRSAEGKKGGLRLAGDSMSAVARYSEFVKVEDRFSLLMEEPLPLHKA